VHGFSNAGGLSQSEATSKRRGEAWAGPQARARASRSGWSNRALSSSDGAGIERGGLSRPVVDEASTTPGRPTPPWSTPLRFPLLEHLSTNPSLISSFSSARPRNRPTPCRPPLEPASKAPLDSYAHRPACLLSLRFDALATFCEGRAQGKRACIERESESKDREEREGVRKGKQCTGEEQEEGRSFYD